MCLSAMLSYNGEERFTGVVPFVLGIVVLYLLFNEKAHDFFAKLCARSRCDARA